MATLPELLKTLVELNGLRPAPDDQHAAAGARARQAADARPAAARRRPRPRRSPTACSPTRRRSASRRRWSSTSRSASAASARFRCNVFNQRGAVGGGLPRRSPRRSRRSTSSACRRCIATLAERPRGLVLVTGPTGSGKSTTLAAMIDKINTERREHILTIEDPIEYIHQHKGCLVNQREVHSDTHGLRRARCAPRCARTPTSSSSASCATSRRSSRRCASPRPGHLTFATLHTNSAAQTINRIIDVFPAHQQGQIRTQLSLVLEGIVCQALLPRADGKGRVVALEILVPTPAIRNLIRDDKVHQIYSTMQTGQEKLGMQTMNQSLATLYQKRLITLETAMAASSLKDELEQMISRGAGVVPGAGHATGRARPRRRARGSWHGNRELSHADICLFGTHARPGRTSPASGSPTPWTPPSRRCGASRSWSRGSTRRRPPRPPRRSRRPRKGGQVGPVEEPGDLHPAVLRHDRRRPAARAVPRHPRQAGAAQELLAASS